MLLLRSSSHDYGYSQYNQRARVEGQIARWKQVIGDGLRFHSDEAQVTAVLWFGARMRRLPGRLTSDRRSAPS